MQTVADSSERLCSPAYLHDNVEDILGDERSPLPILGIDMRVHHLHPVETHQTLGTGPSNL